MRAAYQDIIVRTKSAATVDAEGAWAPTVTDTHYRGSFHQKFTEEAQPNEVGKYGERRLLVIRLPITAIVNNNDLIVLQGYNYTVDGVYVIEGLTFTRTHLRLDVRRTLFNE
jgi:hypothetical protein